MNISLLTGLVFVAVFACVVFIHELGHFLVARLLKVEVEEFGFGLPPRILTMWREKGYILLKSGQRLVIPRTFGLPFGWSSVINHELNITADRVDDMLILRTLEWQEVTPEKNKKTISDPLKKNEIHVDEAGRILDPHTDATRETARQIVVGEHPGSIELTDVIAEAHPGVELTLNWLPIGGFVRPKGENDPTVPGGLAASSPWTRLAVLFAGPTMNLLLGIVVFSLLFYQMGVPDYTQVQIGAVLPDSPAAQAGIQVNDVIATVNGAHITDSTQLHNIIYANLDKPVVFTVRRGKETLTLTATPSSTRPPDKGALGISMGPAIVQSGSVTESLQYGSMAVYLQARALVLLPAQMIRGQLTPQEGRVIGLKGIYDLFGQAVNRDVQSRAPLASTPSAPVSSSSPTPTFFTLQLIGALTISLGVLNLFPFPALDGGRILFVLPEIIFRRRVPPEWENRINAIGMAILLLFMLYVNVMDFVSPAITNLP
ncbi:MAG: M50 family metallopeptidase [Chloroflexi bacterium]|nr:M50 family metallopeptidase [Chloroflexota bacterium]